MDIILTGRDRKKIGKALRKKYKKVAQNPSGLFKYPTGRAGLEALQYPTELINALPETVTDSYCGVGNPFALGPLNQGEAALDIGCGSGVDAIFAAMMTGRSGKVVGIDATPEMLKRAEQNLARVSYFGLAPLFTTYWTHASADHDRTPRALARGVRS